MGQQDTAPPPESFGFNLSPRMGQELRNLITRSGGRRKVIMKAIVKAEERNVDNELVTALIPGNGSTDKEIVLLLTGQFVEGGLWSSEQRREFILAIATAAAALPHARLIIKLHAPQESEQDYDEIIKGLPHPPIVCKYAPLHELLNACSLAMTVSSTAALEAMALGRPVILVNLFNDAGALFYKGSGALFAEKEKDILPAINKALYDSQTRNEMAKSMENFVYQQAHLQDGQASKRIADLIIQMIEESRKARVET